MTGNHKTRVIVGMSGGVDSSIAALLLQQQGYDIEGVFMKNWEEDDTDVHCSAEEDLRDARLVCDSLNIPLRGVNFSTEYWDRVFNYFLETYRAGQTPNPDVLCNKEIKFRAFLDYALSLGADFIATGHYARVHKRDDGFYLLRGKDHSKDQSYFLYTLGQVQLSRSMMPLGELHKTEVRELARQHQLATSEKKDSTGICFIGERNFREFLQRYLPANPGPMKTPEGNVIGEHNGLMYYTLGQRQGLGIGGLKDYPDAPWFVVAKDIPDNTLYVAQGHDHPLLLSRWLEAVDLHWVSDSRPTFPFTCQAQTRYRQQAASCHVESLSENRLRVSFDEPQWAATPGQSVVFYDGDICLGGGTIALTEQTTQT